jgi:hypothetical protein
MLARRGDRPKRSRSSEPPPGTDGKCDHAGNQQNGRGASRGCRTCGSFSMLLMIHGPESPRALKR